MKGHINHSWREQAKGVVCISKEGKIKEYSSVWQASLYVSDTFGCKFDTARKEIRKAIKQSVERYGCRWAWQGDNSINN